MFGGHVFLHRQSTFQTIIVGLFFRFFKSKTILLQNGCFDYFDPSKKPIKMGIVLNSFIAHLSFKEKTHVKFFLSMAFRSVDTVVSVIDFIS